jgi:hypothetical protein
MSVSKGPQSRKRTVDVVGKAIRKSRDASGKSARISKPAAAQENGDDFGKKLVRRKGTVPRDIDLEF